MATVGGESDSCVFNGERIWRRDGRCANEFSGGSRRDAAPIWWRLMMESACAKCGVWRTASRPSYFPTLRPPSMMSADPVTNANSSLAR